MGPVFSLLIFAITIYIWIIIVQILISWLIIFDVINAKNEQAQNLINLLKKATDPVFTPLRKYVPSIGGVDITPIIVILGLSLLQSLIINGI